jgi:hypothetical protein
MEEIPSKTLSGSKTVTGFACRARIEKKIRDSMIETF